MWAVNQPTHNPPDQDAGDAARSEPQIDRILRSAQGGSEDAWRQILEQYSRRVYAMVRSRLSRPDLAEEVTQDVFVTVATKLAEGAYSERGRFESWLFRITMNRVRDEARRLARHAQPTDPFQITESAGTSHDAPADEGADPQTVALREAIDSLGPEDRLIVELRHMAQMSFKQIAAHLDTPLGTILARHHRALRKLRTILEHPPTPSPTEHPS